MSSNNRASASSRQPNVADNALNNLQSWKPVICKQGQQIRTEDLLKPDLTNVYGSSNSSYMEGTFVVPLLLMDRYSGCVLLNKILDVGLPANKENQLASRQALHLYIPIPE